jgi:DNA primase
MAQRVDIALVRKSVSIEQILTHYGFLETLTRKGDSLVGPCPMHQGKNKTQFSASISKNIFRCFGDCVGDSRLHNGGGNHLNFVIVMEGIEEPDDHDQHKAARKAALLMAEWFDIGSQHTTWKPPPSRQTAAVKPLTVPPTIDVPLVQPTAQEPLVNQPLPFTLRDLDANHPYLTARGFSPETAAYFGAGFHAGKGIMKGRIVLPIHDVDGTLVAYAGRWPGDEPPEGEGKYRLPPGFHKSLVVYSLNRAKACARQHGLVLVEGFFDAMRLHQLGVCHAIAIMGSSMSTEQENLIVDAVGPQGKVTLLFDGDASGRTCTQDVLSQLGKRVYTKALYLPDGIQPDHLTKEELKALGR